MAYSPYQFPGFGAAFSLQSETPGPNPTNPSPSPNAEGGGGPEQQNPEPNEGGGGGGTNQQSPCAIGYKKEYKADGSFECVKDSAGGNPYGCSGDDVKINLDSNGKPGAEVCVSQAEAMRRNKLWIGANPGTPAEGSGSGSGSGGGTVSPFNPSTTPYQFQPWTPPPKTPFEIDLGSQISDYLKNWDKSVPYTPEVIRNQKTDAFRASFGRTGSDKAAIEADAVRRGVLRSTGTDRRLDSAQRGAESNYAQADRTIDDTATQANDAALFRNRTAALDRAQNHLDREREYLLASETNDFRRQSGMAQLALAYYGLEQERWALTQNIKNSNYQFGANIDLQKLYLQWQMMQGLA